MDKQKEIEQLQERKFDSTNIFDGVILHVKKDTVILPNGQHAGRELIRHVGAVAMVALREDGKVAVERQFRYPVDEIITEIPAGKLDSKEEDRLEAAKRELLEETGITAQNWLLLGNLYPTPAYSDEIISLYLARDLSYGDRKLDEDEFLNVEWVPLEQLVDEVMAGQIPDSKTQAAVLRTARLLGK